MLDLPDENKILKKKKPPSRGFADLLLIWYEKRAKKGVKK
jgi:hypothetical protein